MDKLVIGSCSFTHVGDGVYKADDTYQFRDDREFNALRNGVDVVALYTEYSDCVIIEAICDYHDESAVRAMHAYREKEYYAHGKRAILSMLRDDKCAFGGITVV